MYPVWFTFMSLSVGQPGPPPVGYPVPVPAVQPAAPVIPTGLPDVPPPAAAADPGVQWVAGQQPGPGGPVADPEKPKPQDFTVTVPPTPKPETPAASAAPAPPVRWGLMKVLQGTWYGAVLDDNRTSVSGWTEMSYTLSTTDITNQPVVWNDRANKFLLNQHWTRIERSVVTSGTNDITWGYRADILFGSDYRFSLMRGIWNSQLDNFNGTQNLYGVDPIQFYANIYIPNLFEGTDIRVGRLWTPFGYESLEGISTPFVSRSYAFNWCPPFTHMGVMMTSIINKQWTVKLMVANGNDVFIDPSQEARFVGAVTWTSLNQKDVVTFGTSVGRGKFNAGDPFNPATVGLQTEPAGRNNINVFDLVWTHTFNPKIAYAAELIYGYQTSVPANVPGGIVSEDAVSGTAHWGSFVQYLTYNFSERLTGITRFELFDDFEGQRTGFEGLYTAITVGAQIKPTKWLMFRPELRYDHNNYTKPFEGKSGIFTAAMDCIVRW